MHGACSDEGEENVTQLKTKAKQMYGCHQNEGEDGCGAALFTWPFVHLHMENVGSTDGHHSALRGS